MAAMQSPNERKRKINSYFSIKQTALRLKVKKKNSVKQSMQNCNLHLNKVLS